MLYSLLLYAVCTNLSLLLKQRKNPFNTEFNASHPFEEKDSQLLDGAVDQNTQKPSEGEFNIL